MRKFIIYAIFPLTLAWIACSKPTEQKIAEFRNNRYKIVVRSREFHNSGIRNLDVCIADVNNPAFPEDKGQCFLRGFDFSNLSVNWISERNIEILFDCGKVMSFTNFAVISKGQVTPMEFHAYLHETCSAE